MTATMTQETDALQLANQKMDLPVSEAQTQLQSLIYVNLAETERLKASNNAKTATQSEMTDARIV